MPRSRLKSYTAAALLLFAGAMLRIWLVARFAVIQNDSSLYAEIAHNWAQFHIYGFSTDALPRPTIIRLPGYPLFLITAWTFFGHWFSRDSFTPVFLLQGIFDLLGCVLLAKTAAHLVERMAGDDVARRVFLFTLAVACLCPFTANYVATPLTESPTLFTISLTLYAFERWLASFQQSGKGFNRYVALLPVALAYSAMLRPDQVLLGVAFLPAMLWAGTHPSPMAEVTPLQPPAVVEDALESRMRRRLHAVKRLRPSVRATAAPAVFAMALTLLPFVPWTVRNWRTFHVFQPLAPRYATEPTDPINYGFQRWYRTWAADFASTEEFYWNYPDDTIDITNLPDRAFDSDAEYDTTAQIFNDFNESPHYHAEIDARFGALAATRIQNDPLRYYVEMPVARLLNMLFHPRTEMLPWELRWWQYRQHPSQTIYSWCFVALNLAFYIAAVFGAIRCWRVNRLFTAACIAYVVLRCLLLLTLDNAEQRYTLEFYPILIVWIGVLVGTFRRQMLRSSRFARHTLRV